MTNAHTPTEITCHLDQMAAAAVQLRAITQTQAQMAKHQGRIIHRQAQEIERLQLQAAANEAEIEQQRKALQAAAELIEALQQRQVAE